MPLLAPANARGAAKSKGIEQRGGNRCQSISHNSCNPEALQLTQNMTLKPNMKYLMQQLTSGPL